MEGFPLLDSPALISATIFLKIQLNLQNFQISLVCFPVSEFVSRKYGLGVKYNQMFYW